MGTSLISIKDVASAQFEFRVEDWADRSRLARELAISINGYEVSPRPRGYACHRPRWVWVEADAAGRRVSVERLPAARPDRCADADHAARRQRRRLAAHSAGTRSGAPRSLSRGEVVTFVEVRDQAGVGRLPAHPLSGQRARGGVVEAHEGAEEREVLGGLRGCDARGRYIESAPIAAATSRTARRRRRRRATGSRRERGLERKPVEPRGVERVWTEGQRLAPLPM